MQAILIEQTRFSSRQFGLFETLTRPLDAIPVTQPFDF
jgi:hypothetical protein